MFHGGGTCSCMFELKHCWLSVCVYLCGSVHLGRRVGSERSFIVVVIRTSVAVALWSSLGVSIST